MGVGVGVGVPVGVFVGVLIGVSVGPPSGWDLHVSFNLDKSTSVGAVLLVERVLSVTDRRLLRVSRRSTGTSIANGALQRCCCDASRGGAFTYPTLGFDGSSKWRSAL